MAKTRKKFDLGVKLKETDQATTSQGEVRVDSADDKLKVYLDGSERSIVSENQTQTLTNKSIDADNNTISNLEVDNLKSGVLDTDLNSVSASDDTIPSAKATKDYVDQEIGTVGTDLTNHISDTSTHGVTGDIVGTTDTQTLTNKSYSGTLNDITINESLKHDLGGFLPATSPFIIDGNSVNKSYININLLTIGADGTLSEIDNFDDFSEVTLINSIQNQAIPANVIIQHEAGAGKKYFSFPNGQNLVLKPGQFATFYNDSARWRLKSLGSEVDLGQLQSDFNQLETDFGNHESASSGVHGVTGSVVGTTDAQSLTNKNLNDNSNTFPDFTLTGDVTGTLSSNTVEAIQNVPVPAPVSGDDGKALIYNHTAGEFEYGEAGGGGGINYLEGDNSDAETSIGSWLTYNDSSTTTPNDGFGGSPNVTFIRSTSSPLRGDGSFLFTKDAADRQGQGSSVAFVIDNADQAKKLTISFDYDATSANYADGDVRVFIYDITNLQLIRVNGEDLKAGKSTHYAQFQTAPNSTSYRLIFHVATTKATSYSIKFDNIKVGPTNLAFGTIVTDPVLETFSSKFGAATTNPTLATTKAEDKYVWWREGKYLNVQFIYFHINNTGTNNGSGNRYISLPAGLAIDNSLTTTNANRNSLIGTWSNAGTTTGLSNALLGDLAYRDNTSLWLRTMENANTTTHKTNNWQHTQTLVNQITDATLAISGHFKVPIQGWSSNARMSEDLGGREVFLTLAPVAQSIANNTITTINTTAIIDTTNSYSGGVWTCPETGIYQIISKPSMIVAASSQLDAGFSINSVSSFTEQAVAINTSGSGQFLNPICSSIKKLNKGDSIRFLVRHFNGSPTNLVASDSLTEYSIVKIPSPQTMLETETVAMTANNSSGQSMPHDASTVVIFNQKPLDTHNGYNASSGVYTVPASGIYRVSCQVVLNVGASTSTGAQLSIRNNASSIAVASSREPIASSSFGAFGTNIFLSSQTQVALNKGDLIDCVLYHFSDDSSAKPLAASGANNIFSVTRIK